MNKILKAILLTSIAVLGVGFLLVSPVSADVQPPLIVQFQRSPSLFQDADLKPGDIVQGWIKVTNNSGSTQKIDIQAINFTNPIPTDDLSRVLSIVIRQGSTDLYGGTSTGGAKLLYDFYNDGETFLSDLANGDTVQYDIIISFPFDTGNNWQTTTTGFDIKIIGSWGTESDNPPGDQPPGITITAETTGGGSGGGAGPSEPSIIEGSIQASGCSSVEVNIHWLSTYFSTSQVVYSSQYEPHNFDLNAPNYGYSHATNENLTMVTGHDVKIYGFTAGTTYYYRTISRASLSSISLEHSFVDQQDCQTSGPQQTPPFITPYSTSGGSNSGVLPPLGGLPFTPSSGPNLGGNAGGLVSGGLAYNSSGTPNPSSQTPGAASPVIAEENPGSPFGNFLTAALAPVFKFLLDHPYFWPLLVIALLLLYMIAFKSLFRDPYFWPILATLLLLLYTVASKLLFGGFCGACFWPMLIIILLLLYIVIYTVASKSLFKDPYFSWPLLVIALLLLCMIAYNFLFGSFCLFCWPLLVIALLLLCILYIIASKSLFKDPYFWPIVIIILLLLYFVVAKFLFVDIYCCWLLLIIVLLLLCIIMHKRNGERKKQNQNY